jgi:Skp family chaperone for outer membrane proteins
MDIEELHRVVVQGFASVTDRFDSVDARLTAVEAKVDAVQDQMNAEFGRVKDALMEHGRQLKDIRAALDRKVDRDELEARH